MDKAAYIKDYVDELQNAIAELRAIHPHINFGISMDGKFYVKETPGRRVCEENKSLIVGAPLSYNEDPLDAIRKTLDNWKEIQPPDELHIRGRRVLWVHDHWVDLGEVKE